MAINLYNMGTIERTRVKMCIRDSNKGEARKFYLQEAEKIAAQIPVAQEELIRITDNVYNELKELVDTGKSRLAMLNKEKAAHRGRIISMGINLSLIHILA